MFANISQYWNVYCRAVRVRSIVVMALKCTRHTNNWIGAKAWDSSEVLSIHDDLKPYPATDFNDMHCAAVSNAPSAWGVAFSVNDGKLSVRVLQNMDIPAGTWVRGVVSWPVST